MKTKFPDYAGLGSVPELYVLDDTLLTSTEAYNYLFDLGFNDKEINQYLSTLPRVMLTKIRSSHICYKGLCQD